MPSLPSPPIPGTPCLATAAQPALPPPGCRRISKIHRLASMQKDHVILSTIFLTNSHQLLISTLTVFATPTLALLSWPGAWSFTRRWNVKYRTIQNCMATRHLLSYIGSHSAPSPGVEIFWTTARTIITYLYKSQLLCQVLTSRL